MNVENIILAVIGLGVFGDILMRLLFKSNRRIADSKAVEAEAEAMKATEDAHAERCRQYEARIADLHSTIDKLNEQLDHYVERDAAKEERFDNQTKKLREVQAKLYAAVTAVTDITREKGKAELELAKKRCDDLACPFRLPPNAYTPTAEGDTKESYFKERKKTTKSK